MPVYRRTDTKSKRFYYKFQIRGVTYKRNIPTARTLRQAEEAERKARDDVHAGIYGTGQDMLFTDFVEKFYKPWAEHHHKGSESDATNTKLLCEHFKGQTLGRISRFSVETFKVTLAKRITQYGTPFKPNSVNTALAFLSIIMNLAVNYGKLKANPVSRVKRIPIADKRPRHLLPEEEERLLIACETQKPWLKSMVQMAIWTGFRMGELRNLQKHHIDLERNLIFAPGAKWKRDKRITEGNPMSRQTRELAQRLCAESRGYLFEGPSGRLQKSGVAKYYRRACQAAGITGLNFHALRHTFGTRLGERDVNLKKIARLMGHSTTKHTEIYVHTTDEGLARAVEFATVESQIRTARPELRIAGTA